MCFSGEFDIGCYMVYNNICMKIHLLLVSLIAMISSSCIPVVMDGPPPGEPIYNNQQPIMPYQRVSPYPSYNGGGGIYDYQQPPQQPTHYGGPDMPQSRIGGFMPRSWAEAKRQGA